MAGIISAEEGALKAGADAVAEAKKNIDGQIKTVHKEIERLSGFWTGAAAVAFTDLLGTWDRKASTLNAVLDNLEDALRGTEKAQAASEQAHQQTIAGLGSMMA